MIRFDRLPKAVRDKVNYADMQYYVTADGRLTVGTPGGGGAKAHQSRTPSSITIATFKKPDAAAR
jgi:hypothetical protein